MAYRKTPMTRKSFKNRVEGFLFGAMGWHCMAEVAAANGYPDHMQHWQAEVERILFIDLTFFIISATTETSFDRRRAINELIAECNSAKTFQVLLLIARKNLAVRYIKRPRPDLKLPDAGTSRNAFWRMVSGAVEFTFEE
jgi:hypothetical protein